MVTGTVNAVTNLTKGTVTVVETLLNGTVTVASGTVYVGKATIASTPAHTTAGVTSVSQTVSATSATRKYLAISNFTSATVWIGLATASVLESGIPLYANGATYEFSQGLGNLFTGDVTAITSGTVSRTIQIVEG
jgi:hypothetical protein